MTAPPRARAPRRLGALLLVALVALASSAHVGTLNAFFAGMAGPYRVQVTVRPPGVVPGLAQVTVRIDGDAITRVTTQAAQWNVGTRGAPAPDEAARVPGDSALWSSELWLMTRGSYAVHVTVVGAAGEGRVSVPVTNVATEQKAMPAVLGWILGGLGLFLSLGLVSLVGAAVREGVVAPGLSPPPERRRRARVAMVVSAVLLALVLSGGRAWWKSVDAAYARGLYRPMEMELRLRTEDGGRRLQLAITDSAYLRKETTPIIPDHGKLVHLFLVREGMDALAHLHPAAVDSATFEGTPGPIPAGRYRYFADVVHESGYAQTVSGSLEVDAPGMGDERLSDGDDAVFVGLPAAAPTVTFPDGSSVTWNPPSPPSLRAGADVLLRFVVRDAGGAEAELEPYMGMPAHAMVARDDGSVFAHLHSNGSFSMAAQQALAAIERGDTLASTRRNAPRPNLAAAADDHAAHLRARGTLEFPFAFPQPGPYAVWVQFRLAGEIRTAAWALEVGR